MTESVIPGDPFGPVRKEAKRPGATPREVNEFHARSDCDTSVFSQHHTLGVKHDQGSPGDHNHDGTISKKIGSGLALTLTGAKGGNVALTNLIALLAEVIEFTDSTT